jgi:DNA-binding MarR family transcriptional regulator
LATRTRALKVLDRDKVRGLSEWQSLDLARNALFRVQDVALLPRGIALPQLQVLAFLAYEQRPLTIGQLASWMVREPNSLSKHVDRAEAKGWVRTRGDPRDRRKRLVEFTEAGVKKFEEARTIANKASEKLFGALDQSEKEQLKVFCQKLYDVSIADLLCRPASHGQ